MIVAVEGVDAAGKSTLCNGLVKSCGGIVYPTPPSEFRRRRRNIDHFSSPDESLSFYREGLVVAAEEICDLNSSHQNIFVDRHWISTAATHLAICVKVDIVDLLKFQCAHLTVLLTIDAKEQLLRFEKRTMTASDKNLLHLFNIIDSNYKQLVMKHCQRHLIVDTCRFSEDEAIEIVAYHLHKGVH